VGPGWGTQRQTVVADQERLSTGFLFSLRPDRMSNPVGGVGGGGGPVHRALPAANCAHFPRNQPDGCGAVAEEEAEEEGGHRRLTSVYLVCVAFVLLG